MNEIAPTQDIAAAIEDALARNDLSKLTIPQRMEWLSQVCKTTGMNPITQPIAFYNFQGKVVPYVKKDGTDQLRKINGISVEVVGYETTESGLLKVHVRAVDKTGRTDEDFGVVAVKGLVGEAASNAFMKAVTKAKRRVTLSISGLGLLDESEIEAMTPTFGSSAPQPLRLHLSQSQEERSKAVNEEAEGHQDGLDAQREQQERVPDRSPSDAERAGTEPFVIPRPDDSDASWATWWGTLLAYVKAAPDAEAINAWTVKNAESMGVLFKLDKDKHSKLIKQIKDQIANRSTAGP